MHQFTRALLSIIFTFFEDPRQQFYPHLSRIKSKTIRKHAESGFIISQFDSNNGPQGPGENSLEIRAYC